MLARPARRVAAPFVRAISASYFSTTPRDVQVYEVAPRDGLQNEPVVLTVDQKLEIVMALAEARPATVEVCSFVRADRVPTMAGAEELCQKIQDAKWAQEARTDGTKFSALVLNKKGYERFLEAPLDTIAFAVSCTDGHSKANTGKDFRTALEAMCEVATWCRSDGIESRGYASMAFGCPIEGDVDPAAVQECVTRYAEANVDTVIIADTIGVAHPEQVQKVCEAALGVLPGHRLGLHMHDTYGRAVANCTVGLELGLQHIDAAVGGTGGCPFAKGSAGNLATEHLMELIDGQGKVHGVSHSQLTAANGMLQEALGRELVQFATKQ